MKKPIKQLKPNEPKFKRFISKKHLRLWDKQTDEDYNYYMSGFATIVPVIGGFVMFLINQNDVDKSILNIKNKHDKIKAIESLLTDYHKHNITLKMLMENIRNYLVEYNTYR